MQNFKNPENADPHLSCKGLLWDWHLPTGFQVLLRDPQAYKLNNPASDEPAFCVQGVDPNEPRKTLTFHWILVV